MSSIHSWPFAALHQGQMWVDSDTTGINRPTATTRGGLLIANAAR